MITLIRFAIADAPEGPDEVAGSTGRPLRIVTLGRCLARPAEVEPVGCLLRSTGEQLIAGKVGDRQVAVAGPGFDRPGPQAAVDPLDLLAYAQFACVEIHVCPSQAFDLAPAYAVEDQEDECGAQRIGPAR